MLKRRAQTRSGSPLGIADLERTERGNCIDCKKGGSLRSQSLAAGIGSNSQRRFHAGVQVRIFILDRKIRQARPKYLEEKTTRDVLYM